MYMKMAVACYTAGGLQPNKSEADAKTPLLRIKCRDGDIERLTLAAAIFPAFALLLPERIGLKPLPDREKAKEDYSLLQSSSFQVDVAIPG